MYSLYAQIAGRWYPVRSFNTIDRAEDYAARSLIYGGHTARIEIRKGAVLIVRVLFDSRWSH